MAVLSDPDREIVWADFMRDLSRDFDSLALSKTDLRAALDATDAWIDSNAASYNSALPAAARVAMSATQKARLFLAVAGKRYGVL